MHLFSVLSFIVLYSLFRYSFCVETVTVQRDDTPTVSKVRLEFIIAVQTVMGLQVSYATDIMRNSWDGLKAFKVLICTVQVAFRDGKM